MNSRVKVRVRVGYVIIMMWDKVVFVGETSDGDEVE